MENNPEQQVSQKVQPDLQNLPSQKSTADKNFFQRNIILIIAILIILAILCIGVNIYVRNSLKKLNSVYNIQPSTILPTPTPDTTANWKAYINEKYGFEFEYPITFSLNNAFDSQSIVAFTDKSNTKRRLSTLPDISLRVIPIIPGEDYKNILIKDVVFSASGLHPKSFSEFLSKTVGSNSVYYIKTGLFEGALSMNYYLLDKSQIIVFSLVSSPVDWTNPNYNFENDSLNQNLLQMLSTFKFTN